MNTYAELHAHSYFSLLDGVSTPEALVRRAAALGLPALALTDHDNLIGAVELMSACEAHHIQPIFGAEITLAGGHHLTLLAADQRGYRNLCRLVSLAHRDQSKGEAALPYDALAAHHDGLLLLSGCARGELATALLARRWDEAARLATRYRALVGPERFFIELQQHHLPHDRWLLGASARLAERFGLRCVATGNVHYALPEEHRLQNVVTCIRHNTTLDKAGRLLRPNAECYLRSADEMGALFGAYPDAVRNSLHIARMCNVQLHYGVQSLPNFAAPDGLSAPAYLRALCEEALTQRYAADARHAQQQLAHELAIIEAAGLSNYFLIVWDIVHFARVNHILCQGRGSAANSLVAYLLDISPIDPLAHDLLFERFLSSERQLPPDIDMDIDAARREEVIQYVYDKYGWEHAAMACTLVTFRARSAIRDVAKALGFPPLVIDQLAKTVDGYRAGHHPTSDMQHSYTPSYHDVERTGDLEPAESTESFPQRQLRELCAAIDGLPRHLGIHNGGMVIMGSPLIESIPVEPASMPDRVVVQWDKDMLDKAGLVKIDLLGLRMLSAIAQAVELVEQVTGKRPSLETLTFDDPAVYEMICKGDTIGIFQIESAAQAQMIPHMQPRTFEDIIVEISLVRPGPMLGNMVRPYIKRRKGLEPVAYLHPLLEPALRETLGVILFQEQVLKVSRDLAGFSAGQGELLRRAMGSKRAETEIEKFRAAFIEGAAAMGVAHEIAEQVFQQLLGFGGYAFPKSHAAAFAVLVYWSAWLKQYHAAAFYTAILNNEPMGFYSAAVVAGDARQHKIALLPVHADRSRSRCTLVNGAIRLGFSYVHGVGEAHGEQIEQAQQGRPFRSLADFCVRTQLPRRTVENLIMVGTFDHLNPTRRKLIWELGKLRYEETGLELVFPNDDIDLPPFSVVERTITEYTLLGVAVGAHPMSLYERWCRRQRVLSRAGLSEKQGGELVRVAGLVAVRQSPPTAKGFLFITLDAGDGLIHVIVNPTVYEKQRALLRHEPLLVIEGRVQNEGGYLNVLAERAVAVPYQQSASNNQNSSIVLSGKLSGRDCRARPQRRQPH